MAKYFIRESIWLTAGQKGQKCMNASCCHPSGETLEASILAAHFCCRFFHLNFILAIAENSVLSESTLNTGKNVVILRI